MEERRNYKVYCHTNLINGKKYVGQTKQKVERRWRNGGVGYKPPKGKNSHFWNSICKYTWDCFKHEILHDNLTSDEADYLEKYYIDKWDLMNPDKGYNEKDGGGNSKISDATKRKLSESHKGYKVSQETKEKLRQINKKRIGDKNPMYGKGKIIICLETGEIFNSARIASNKLNIDSSSIISVCRGRRKSAGNLHFCYLKNYNKDKKYDLSSRKKKIICLNTNEIFNSINEAKIKLNINNGHISDVCNEKLKSIKGFKFKYYVDK